MIFCWLYFDFSYNICLDMLLQPRKFRFKNRHKCRTFFTAKAAELRYGEVGLRLLQPLRFNSRQLFRLKIYLKKATRRAEFTKRRLWFNAFPHLPLSKKSKGVRMGKGTGKLSIWFTQLYAGSFFLEARNLRLGRSYYFMKQTTARLPVPAVVVRSHRRPITWPHAANLTVGTAGFF